MLGGRQPDGSLFLQEPSNTLFPVGDELSVFLGSLGVDDAFEGDCLSS